MRKKDHNKKRKARNRLRPMPLKATGFVAMPGPWAGIPKDAARSALRELGAKRALEFETIRSEIEQLFRNVHPLLTLSALTQYGLFSGLSEDGAINESFMGERFSQCHVEQSQGLLLRIAKAEVSDQPIVPEQLARLFEALPQLSLAFDQRRLKDVVEPPEPGQTHLRRLQEWLRLHTQGMRHWTYFDHAQRLLHRLCVPVDDLFVQQIGCRFTACITVFSHLVRSNDQRITERSHRFHPVTSKTSVDGMIRAFFSQFPETPGSVEAMLEYATKWEISLDHTKALLLSYSDLTLPDAFTSTAINVADRTGLPFAEFAVIMKRFSMTAGDLAATDVETLFLANPVWLKPVIALPNERYFCVLPQVFFSHSFNILHDVFAGKRNAGEVFSRHRAQFLEDEIATLFATNFPGAQLARGYTWTEEGKKYESDLIVRVDTHLLLIEAKSGAISAAALRGAPDRMRRHFEEILIAPSIQSARLATRIESALDVPSEADNLIPEFPIRLHGISHILRLSVTLEDFATIQSRMHALRDAGIVPTGHSIAPCILLTDLETVFDILESAGRKLHYLRRRGELESNFNYVGDELDLLGFYLQTAFAIGTAEFSEDEFTLLGFSRELDHHYMVKQEGIVTPKPSPQMTDWWRIVCGTVESRHTFGWSSLLTILLGVSHDEQKQLEINFERVKKVVRRDYKNADHRCCMVLIPPACKSDAVALLAYRNVDHDRRKDRAAVVAEQAFNSANVQRCVVIGVNIDDDAAPYSFVYLLLRSTENLTN
jgi:hypothetical protein